MKYDCKRRTELYNKFSKEFDLLDKFDFLVGQIFDNSNSDKTTFPESETVKEVVWFLTGKAVKSYNAARMLCEQGYATDALVIERTLIDLLISLNYILERDSDERAKMFIAYEWVLKFKSWHYGRINLINHTLSPEELKISGEMVKGEYEKVCQKYKHFDDWRLPWTGEKTADMVKRLGLKFYYEIVYSYVSDFVHSSPTSAKHYLQKKEEHHKLVKIGASDDLIPEAVITLVILICEILFIVNDIFSLGKRDKLLYFKSRLDQYTDNIKKERQRHVG